TLKRVGANLELPQRGILSSLRDIKPHQLAMRILIRRIESKEPQCRDDGRFGAVTRDLMIEQEPMGLDRQFTEPAALRREPFLERFGLQIEAVQEVAVTERDGLQQRPRRGVSDQALQPRGIDIERGRIDGNLIRAREYRGAVVRAGADRL